MVIAKDMGTLEGSKQTIYIFRLERSNHSQLNEEASQEQHLVDMSNGFAALENLDVEVDINRTWKPIRAYIDISAKESLGYYELKKHKLWSDEECSELLDQRNQEKLQWLQKLRHKWAWRSEKREFLMDKTNELTEKSKKIRELYEGINTFKRGYQSINTS
jgi:hypothetical protein